MKTKQLFLGLLAAAALVGCSSDDTLSNDSSNAQVGDGNPRYLNVNIMPTSSLDTRIDGYEDGSDAENKVNKIRFYFFTDDGNAANVKKTSTGSYVNYYDWESTGTSAGDPSQTVEKKINATIVISTPAGDLVPSKMIAVLNFDKVQNIGSASRNLYSVRSLKQDWATLTSESDGYGFVMCNSVYASNSKERVSTSTIGTENLGASETAALANPVNIYVERNVAKVTLKIDETNLTKTSNGDYLLKDAKGADLTVVNNGQTVKVYARPLYWGLTAVTTQANLSKHINPTWRTNLLTPEGLWSSVDYHRSFWAVNCLSENSGTEGEDLSGAKYYSFDEIKAQNHSMTGTDVIYTNENAATNYETGEQRTYPTQVICAMQLVDENGKALNVVEYAGSKYVGIPNLKSAMLGTLSVNSRPVKKVTKASGDAYVQLDTTEITFVTESTINTSIAGTQSGEGGRYKVHATLTDDAKDTQWYLPTGDNTYKELTTAEVNTILSDLGHAKIWYAGCTYYYFKVRHLANNDAGKYGVVRNHSYVCTVNDIVGFGTPVYDLKETIYPETPVDENVYIGAQINILQWRLVPSTVSLGKTE